jgi:hypothetical protein
MFNVEVDTFEVVCRGDSLVIAEEVEFKWCVVAGVVTIGEEGCT